MDNNKYYVLTPLGNLTFAQKVDFVACSAPYSLAVADFNGDGKPDIAVVGWSNPGSTGSNVVVLTNMCSPGTISFGSPVKIDSLNIAESIAVGDFNGDGKLDLAVGSGGEKAVYIYINSSSTGSISLGSKIQAASATVTDPRQISVEDFNGDGLPDFATVDGNTNMYTFQNLFTGGSFSSTNFGWVSNYSTGTRVGTNYPGPITLIGADMDRDGRPDVVIGNYYSNNIITFQNVSQY